MRSLRTVLWAGIGMLSAPTVSREVVHIMWLLWLLRSRLLHSASRTSQAAPPHAVIPPLWSLAILPRAYRLLLWALFVIVAGGCATVKRLRIDPSFTYQSLSTGGVVVGGVTSLVGEGGVTQVWMTNLLRRSIIEERPDIVVQPFVVFRRALGQVAYGELLDAPTGMIPQSTTSHRAPGRGLPPRPRQASGEMSSHKPSGKQHAADPHTPWWRVDTPAESAKHSLS